LGVDDTINGNSFCQIFDAANSDIECTPKHLEYHQIACGLSYFAFHMYRVGIYECEKDFQGWMIPVMALPGIQIAAR
jgi:hypothetical protein